VAGADDRSEFHQLSVRLLVPTVNGRGYRTNSIRESHERHRAWHLRHRFADESQGPGVKCPAATCGVVLIPFDDVLGARIFIRTPSASVRARRSAKPYGADRALTRLRPDRHDGHTRARADPPRDRCRGPLTSDDNLVMLH
jgi:hypothetical protein